MSEPSPTTPASTAYQSASVGGVHTILRALTGQDHLVEVEADEDHVTFTVRTALDGVITCLMFERADWAAVVAFAEAER